ncbi:uncharacterized protein [Amphiura filiformis]|uniref:uncharacterized protein n=1 Tax=Amphiura filiformis TaxID=82378 RepID=UPI003B2259F0
MSDNGYVIYIPVGAIVAVLACICKCCHKALQGDERPPSRPVDTNIHSVYFPREGENANAPTVDRNQRDGAQLPHPAPVHPPPKNKDFNDDWPRLKRGETLAIPLPWLPEWHKTHAVRSGMTDVSIPVSSDMNPSVDSHIITSVDQQPSYPPPSYDDTQNLIDGAVAIDKTSKLKK